MHVDKLPPDRLLRNMNPLKGRYLPDTIKTAVTNQLQNDGEQMKKTAQPAAL
jgi:hypothetical protein